MGEAIISRRGSGIDTSDATLTEANALSSLTYYGADGEKHTGTMTNHGAKTASLNCDESYIIPAGYHNGSGRVTGNTLSSQTSDATAMAEDIASGKTVYINGSKVAGTVIDFRGRGLPTGEISYSDSYLYANIGNYYDAKGGMLANGKSRLTVQANIIASVIGLTSEKIKKGTTILNITGKSSVAETNDATATAANIVSGKTAYVNGNKITGTANIKAVSDICSIYDFNINFLAGQSAEYIFVGAGVSIPLSFSYFDYYGAGTYGTFSGRGSYGNSCTLIENDKGFIFYNGGNDNKAFSLSSRYNGYVILTIIFTADIDPYRCSFSF